MHFKKHHDLSVDNFITIRAVVLLLSHSLPTAIVYDPFFPGWLECMTARSNAITRQTHSLVLGTTLTSTETLHHSRCFFQSLADNTLIELFWIRISWKMRRLSQVEREQAIRMLEAGGAVRLVATWFHCTLRTFFDYVTVTQTLALQMTVHEAVDHV